tara:strand:+ start:1173 stop:1628 length:456 start_codon:yes stop_codon:yes gene_type:complete
MNVIPQLTSESLYIKYKDSYLTRSENNRTLTYDLGVVAVDPKTVTIAVKKPYTNYVIQGDFDGKDLYIIPRVDADSNPQVGSFIDIIVQSTTNTGDYGKPPGWIKIIDDAPPFTTVLGDFTNTNVEYRTAWIRCIWLASVSKFRPFLMSEY